MKSLDVVIVGAGPSGVGCGALLKQMGIADAEMLIVEASEVGSSFEAWPEQMKMITPSFPSNGYHQTDLNAITPDSSPAFNSGKEHLTGKDYSAYLKSVVEHYQLRIQTKTRIVKVQKRDNGDFELVSNHSDIIRCRFLIWACGEFNSPKMDTFIGADLCIHNSQVKSWDDFEESDYAVIGCYESGVDAAYNLAIRGKQVTLIDSSSEREQNFDPSRVLSPYTAERLSNMSDMERVTLVEDFRVYDVQKSGNEYCLSSTNGDQLHSTGTPINCSGFSPCMVPVRNLFEWSVTGHPIVNSFDESTLHNNLFLVGPSLMHENVLLCFIYKFRGRFGIPCNVIGTELDLDKGVLANYREAGMLLDDLSCCINQECFC